MQILRHREFFAPTGCRGCNERRGAIAASEQFNTFLEKIMWSTTRKLLKFVIPSAVAILLAAGCTQQPTSPGTTLDVTEIPGSASAQPARPDVSIDKPDFMPSNTYSLARR